MKVQTQKHNYNKTPDKVGIYEQNLNQQFYYSKEVLTSKS